MCVTCPGGGTAPTTEWEQHLRDSFCYNPLRFPVHRGQTLSDVNLSMEIEPYLKKPKDFYPGGGFLAIPGKEAGTEVNRLSKRDLLLTSGELCAAPLGKPTTKEKMLRRKTSRTGYFPSVHWDWPTACALRWGPWGRCALHSEGSLRRAPGCPPPAAHCQY